MNKNYLIDLYIQPGAKKTEIAGEHDGRLKIRLKADPVDGKANKALIDFFSKLLKVRKQDISIVHGEKSRFKTLSVISSTELDLSFLSMESK